MKSSIQQPAYGAIPLSAGGSAGVDASRLQRLVWVLVSEESDDALRVLNALTQGSIMLLILVVIVVDVLQTVDSLLATWDGAFAAVDTFACVVFTCEYALRLWSCVASERLAARLAAEARARGGARAGAAGGALHARMRLAFARHPLSVLDLANIAGFWADRALPSVSFTGSLSFLRSLRMMRLFSLFKFERYARSFNLLARVFAAKSSELTIAGFISLVLLLMCSSVMYLCEGGQKGAGGAPSAAFGSIPAAVLATVPAMLGGGFGPPVATVPGAVASLVIPFVGVSLLAMPTAILGAGFVESLSARYDDEPAPDRGESFRDAPPALAPPAAAGGGGDGARLERLEARVARLDAKLDHILAALLRAEA